MRNFIITITEEQHDESVMRTTHAERLAAAKIPPLIVEHYRRRVIAADIEPAIDALNVALKTVPSQPRKPRADRGKPRKPTQPPAPTAT